MITRKLNYNKCILFFYTCSALVIRDWFLGRFMNVHVAKITAAELRRLNGAVYKEKLSFESKIEVITEFANELSIDSTLFEHLRMEKN